MTNQFVWTIFRRTDLMQKQIEPVVALFGCTSGSTLFHVKSSLPLAQPEQQWSPVTVRSRKTLANVSRFLHSIAMTPPARKLHDHCVRISPSSRSSRAFVLTLVLALVGCGRSSSDTREWQASDHDQAGGQQQGQVPARPGSSSQADSDKSLVELAWQRNCATCHGPLGRGDGPQGPMVRAQDLTRDEWQTKVTDEQIAEVIRKGRNRMPAFESLPPQVITGLVARIRANRER
jgi:mono/diheme cytochrome c family protein